MTLDCTNILKASIIVHFALASLAMFGHWLPIGYMWSQTIIIVLGLWALSSPENVESLNLLAIANVATIILDAIAIGVSWHIALDSSGLFSFTAAMAIILLLFKFAYGFFSFKFARERAGGESFANGLPSFGNWAGGQQAGPPQPNQQAYQNVN